MKLLYLEQQINAQVVEELTGHKVRQVAVGWVQVGTERVPDENDEKQMIDRPITQRGVEIEFEEDTLPPNVLTVLDEHMAKLKLSRDIGPPT